MAVQPLVRVPATPDSRFLFDGEEVLILSHLEKLRGPRPRRRHHLGEVHVSGLKQ